MAVESDADRLAHLVDFGVQIVATVSTVVQPAITGIFDDAFKEDDMQGDRVVAFRPQLTIRTIDHTTQNWSKKTTTVSVNATTWRIHSIEPDGTGISVVKLLNQ